MKAQHLFAMLLGFEKWADLLKASRPELELAKLMWDNQHKISPEDWEMYIVGVEREHQRTYDAESRLEIFKAVMANGDVRHSYSYDYRLPKQRQN